MFNEIMCNNKRLAVKNPDTSCLALIFNFKLSNLKMKILHMEYRFKFARYDSYTFKINMNLWLSCQVKWQ